MRIISMHIPYPVYLRNGEVRCFLCDTDWILKLYSDELRFQAGDKAVP
jgi:hypothetical protein